MEIGGFSGIDSMMGTNFVTSLGLPSHFFDQHSDGVVFVSLLVRIFCDALHTRLQEPVPLAHP